MNRSLALLAAIAFPFSWASGEVVINEIYGGGGKSRAPFNQDFIELFNNGPTAVDIGQFQLQYAGKWSFKTIATIPVGTILEPGAFYLIGGAIGANGAALPHVDLGVSNNLNASGKVELLNSLLKAVDFVGYREGTGQRQTMSYQRIADGDYNSVNFRAQIPTPDAVNTAVPEPSTWMMLGLGAALLAGARRFRRRQS
jgi:hypothetical protein